MLRLTVDHLIQRINRVHPSLSLDHTDVAEWCFEAMEQEGRYDVFEEVVAQPLVVTEGIAQLPKNIYRLLSVRGGCSSCDFINYSVVGSCLKVPYATTTIYVDMTVFATDENGYPLIDDTFMEVCMYYVLERKLYEPFLQGGIAPDKYQDVQAKFISACGKARASMRNRTEDELMMISRMLRSPIPAFRPFRGR